MFSPPCRDAAHAGNYREACARNQRELGKQLSIQSWNICNKIAEVDQFLRRQAGQRTQLREAHPEICFAALNGGVAMSAPKKTSEGAAQRLAVLARYERNSTVLVGRVLAEQRRSAVQRDDVIDALVCYITANQPELASLRGEPARDQYGLAMEMVHTPCRRDPLSSLE